MNVSVIGNGNVVALPGPRTGSPVPLRRGSPEREDGGAPAVTSAREVAKQAWFDLNGDGKIDNRSSLYGGDAYMLAGDLDAASRRSVRQAPAPTAVARPKLTAGADGDGDGDGDGSVDAPSEHPDDTDVVTRHALDAYARYGGVAGPVPTFDPNDDAA